MNDSPKVYLVTRMRKLKDGARAPYYYLKWMDSRGVYVFESIGRARKAGGTITAGQAEERRRGKEHEIAKDRRAGDRPHRITLGEFRDEYLERRRRDDPRGARRGSKRLSDLTIKEHDMALRYLIQHFGAEHPLARITDPDAEHFLDELRAGKLADARLSRQAYRLSEERVRSLVRRIKAVLNWAVRYRFIHANPFEDFDGAPVTPGGRANHYVSRADFEQLVEHAPSPGWRALLGLCRLAGLRRSCEAIRLPWAGVAADGEGREWRVGVDWEASRIKVVGKGGRYREVPIIPRLHELLLDAFDRAPDGATSVTALPDHNLTRRMQSIVEAAGLRAWPKLFHALRSSCENDWKAEGFAEATYSAWLGHSPTVSRTHYVAPIDSEFEAAARTKARTTGE